MRVVKGDVCTVVADYPICAQDTAMPNYYFLHEGDVFIVFGAPRQGIEIFTCMLGKGEVVILHIPERPIDGMAQFKIVGECQ